MNDNKGKFWNGSNVQDLGKYDIKAIQNEEADKVERSKTV
jgi:hypothetical protein